jgi:hypothetical protein
VWACDFVEGRTQDGPRFRALYVVDGLSRECLAIRRLKATDVSDVLADPFILRGVPGHLRSWS